MRIPLPEPCRCLRSFGFYTKPFSCLQHTFSFYLCRGDNSFIYSFNFLQLLKEVVAEFAMNLCSPKHKMHISWIYMGIYISYMLYIFIHEKTASKTSGHIYFSFATSSPLLDQGILSFLDHRVCASV